jgi:hypothetical protein
MSGAPAEQYLTRAVVFPLDPTPAQERLLRSYCGAARFAHNWALDLVNKNLTMRTEQREAGVTEADLTPSQSWSAYSFGKAWNAAKEEAAPMVAGGLDARLPVRGGNCCRRARELQQLSEGHP